MILPLEHHTRGFAFNAHRLEGLQAPHRGQYDPILALDHFMLRQPVFGPHPHAGFSAVTVLFEDSASALRHRDSQNLLGGPTLIAPGDVCWLEAGSGVLHEEVPLPLGQPAHGVQIFVNHAADQRHTPPRAWHVGAASVPEIQQDQARLRLLAGQAGGQSAPFRPHSPLTIIDGFGACSLPWPDHWRVLVLPIACTVEVGGLPIAERHAYQHQGSLHVDGAHWLLLAGPAIGQPFESHGPFVMNDRAGLVAASKAFLSGGMGTLESSA